METRELDVVDHFKMALQALGFGIDRGAAEVIFKVAQIYQNEDADPSIKGLAAVQREIHDKYHAHSAAEAIADFLGSEDEGDEDLKGIGAPLFGQAAEA